MISPDAFTAKCTPWLKYERPQLGVPPPCEMPSVQRPKTFGGPISYTPLERRSEIDPDQQLRQFDFLAPETRWQKFHPNIDFPTHKSRDISTEMSRADFHRYRYMKDLDPERVPRVPNVMSYDPCSCSMPWFNLYGCQRDKAYYTRHIDYRNIRRFPLPKDAGYNGYRHELLDRHNTGNFWNSRRH